MRERIHKSLLTIGVVSVLLTFILSAIMHYQGLQDQMTADLARMCATISGAVEQEDEGRSIAYLERIHEQSDGNIHVVWLEKDGRVLYDSDGDTGENYIAGKEVQEALENGKGEAIHQGSSGKPKSYAAHQAPDGTIIRISDTRNVPLSAFSSFFPEIFIFLLVFLVGCLAAAEQETEYILRPLTKVGNLLQEIMEGKTVDRMPAGYKELQPLISKVTDQRKEIENYLDDLEEERSTIRTVIDTISDGIILLNARKEIIDYNTKTEEIFDPNTDKHFRRIASLYHDEDWLRAIGRGFRAEGSTEYTLTLFDKPYRMRTAKVDLYNEETGLLIVLRDMTAYHMAEQMRREFSANVSHELKTPLTSISGYGEMIASGMYSNEEEAHRFGSRIVSESKRMKSLIDTILHLSKIEETETTITWKMVALDSLVNYVADLMTHQASSRDITIQPETEPVYVYGNAALLSELIMNLLDNSVKYNREGGSVSISLKKEGDKAVLSVSDTGIGIPEDKKDRVFERFYRADESRSKETGGSGLGLAICKHIVEKHKGTLSMTSTEGEGTTVTVYLPCLTDEQVAEENQAELTARQDAADAESGRLAEMEAQEDAEEERLISEEDSAPPEKRMKALRRKNKKEKKKRNKKKKEKADAAETPEANETADGETDSKPDKDTKQKKEEKPPKEGKAKK